MTETLLETVVLQAPNVTVALAALWWASQTIGQLIEANERQQDMLLTMLDRVIAAEERASSASIDD